MGRGLSRPSLPGRSSSAGNLPRWVPEPESDGEWRPFGSSPSTATLLLWGRPPTGKAPPEWKQGSLFREQLGTFHLNATSPGTSDSAALGKYLQVYEMKLGDACYSKKPKQPECAHQQGHDCMQCSVQRGMVTSQHIDPSSATHCL